MRSLLYILIVQMRILSSRGKELSQGHRASKLMGDIQTLKLLAPEPSVLTLPSMWPVSTLRNMIDRVTQGHGQGQGDQVFPT